MTPSLYRLAEMTWSELAEARERAPLALIPVGSCGHDSNHPAIGVLMSRLMADFADLAAGWSGITALAPEVCREVRQTASGFPSRLACQAIADGGRIRGLH